MRRGAPPGLPVDLLADWCHATYGERPVRIGHIHLSGWKAAGAFRVRIRTDRGRSLQVVYKNDVYDPSITPGLAGLPVWPGPPEFAIYQTRDARLSEFLPAIYWAREVTARHQYQYLMEDLHPTFVRALDAEELVLLAATLLPRVQRALAEWHARSGASDLPRYDLAYTEALEPYLERNIRRYAERIGDSPLVNLIARWEEVRAVRLDPAYHAASLEGVVHGDFNGSNIHLHRTGAGLRIVDWEWAGLGLRERDLAALLKGTPERVEREAVALSGEDGRDGLDERWRRYQWCKLERALMDIAFLSAQDLDAPDRGPRLRWRGFNEHAAGRALQALEELRGGQHK